MIKVTFEKDYSKDFNIKFYGWIQLNIFYEGMKRGFEVSLQKYKEIVGVPDENKRN